MSHIRGATSAVAREREARCLELRRVGFTFHQIGRALGVTGDGALKAYNRALERLPGIEHREELRQLEMARLDHLLQIWWPKALAGEQAAFNNVPRLMERRARLLGLDEPNRPNVTVILKILAQLRGLPEAELLEVLGYGCEPVPAPHCLPPGRP
jgi:hypothetical protein